MTDTPFVAKNGIVANTLFTANSTQITLGGNVVVNTSTLSIGNSSVNVSINSTSISGVAAGVNTASTYTWTNNHTFQANVTTANLTAVGTISLQGTVDNSLANVLSQTLTFGTTTNWDASQGQVCTITLTANTTMAAPTNLKIGTYLLTVIQDVTGSRIITWNSVFKWPVGTAPVLTTTGSHKDIISFVCDGTNLYGSFLPDVR